MKRKIFRFTLLFIVVAPLLYLAYSLFVSSRESSVLANVLEYDLVYSEVDHPTFGVLAASKHGDVVAVTHDRSKVVYISPDNRHAVIMLNDAGLPERIVDGDLVMEVGNYTATTMDVAVALPGGQVETIRGVELPEAVRRSASFMPGQASFQTSVQDALSNLPKPTGLSPDAGWFSDRPGIVEGGPALSEVISMAGMAITIGVAATVAVAASPAIAVGVVALAGVSVGLSAYNMIADNNATAVAEIGLGTFLCATTPINPVGGVHSCVTTALAVTNEAVKDAENRVRDIEPELDVARGAIEHGTGDVQATLTWDNSSDIDLWVFAPNGEVVSYANPRTPSGGQLDVDDRDGHGPENIFWPDGQAPSGRYEIHVHHYQGENNTRYLVLLHVDGQNQTFSGTLAPKEGKKLVEINR